MMLKGNSIWIVAVKSHLASQELQLSMLLLFQKMSKRVVLLTGPRNELNGSEAPRPACAAW